MCTLRRLVVVWLFAAPWTIACQAPLSMEFSTQGYRAGCHFHLQSIFPSPGWNISSVSPALAGRLFTTAPPGKIPIYLQISSLENVMALPLVKGLIVVQSSEPSYDDLTNISLQPQTWTFWEIPSENPSENPFPSPDLGLFAIFSSVLSDSLQSYGL